MAVRIAHATDIHWCVPLGPSDLRTPKRIMGFVDGYARGRRTAFDARVQDDLVAHLLALAPDLVLVTGDVTVHALDEEFARARAALDPVLAALPTLLLPGNHDLYSPDAERVRPFHRTFAEWMGLDGGLARARVGPVRVIGLDPNRATRIVSSGRIPDVQLVALAAELASADPGPVLLALHYPPVDRHGRLYDNVLHGLENVAELVAVLDRAPRRPALVACGHKHQGFASALVLSDGTSVPVVNCGSSGCAPRKGRTAAMAVYTFDDGGVTIERYAHDGRGFAPAEPFAPPAPGVTSR